MLFRQQVEVEVQVLLQMEILPQVVHMVLAQQVHQVSLLQLTLVELAKLILLIILQLQMDKVKDLPQQVELMQLLMGLEMDQQTQPRE